MVKKESKIFLDILKISYIGRKKYVDEVVDFEGVFEFM